MSISITDKATCQQAQELAQLTGKTVHDAIAAAIEKRLEREKCARSEEYRAQIMKERDRNMRAIGHKRALRLAHARRRARR